MRFQTLVICVFVLFLTSATAVAQQAPLTPDPADRPWWERLSFSGDFRLRFETFRIDGTPDRNRARMRLRLAVDAEVDESLAVHVRFATGNPLDPSTSNQTFTDFLTEKPFTVDYGYVEYAPAAVEGLTLAGGKFEPPVPHTSMTWEDNITWEGGYQQYRAPEAPVQLTVTAAQVSLAEVSAGRDTLMFAEAGELSVRRGTHRFSVAVVDHVFRNPDSIAVAVAEGALDLPNTNLIEVGPDGTVTGFQSGFHWIDVLGTAVLDTSRAQYPITLTADWLKNVRAVTDQDTGLWMAGTYGLAEAPKSYALTYAYATIEQDAVLSPYMNSDVERTNVRASILEAVYRPSAHVTFVVSGFFPKSLRVPDGTPNPALKRMQFNAEVDF